ncbi:MULTISPECIES: DUF4246 domain-containing protein [unclassified Streptomyces]|uniref:DUF4246 domain-containing protein n=1 Tax=unclassified Streptomyces TaxID=2593676 RepID=UPI002256F633|nr:MULTISPECIES: DUF4246 domain-containing protein [unclassified Streptomyces]MCX5336244.1 DUF4246 domain-containing protein [Streptomyces sp. NBC_00140]MCX5366963.1 DUF4246 domain-containing protein [Streptomyces sp. NBC_00124]
MTELSAFPLPFHASRSIAFATPRTLRELQMMECSSQIRAKPRWFDKMNDADIVARWTREAIAQGLTEAQVQYVLSELRHYAALRDARTGIEVSAVDGVWQSDTLVDDKLRLRLREAVWALEQVPEAEQDWHPGSDGLVLDLVHPSLFCLVREVSGALERAWRNPTNPYSKYEFSEKFQWLPTDVDVSDDGAVAFRSYINNVHPETHRELVSVLPDLFARFRPLWENVLTDLRYPRPLRIEADPYGWYDSEPEYPNKASYSEDEAYAEALRVWEEAQDSWWENRRPVIPDAPAFTPPEIPDGSERVDLRGRSLQVIVKIAAIHLTPDKPEYPGGSWHVEGMMNERIVSTGIYYWDSENITESHLSFRAALDDPSYEQNDDNGLREVYGLEDEDALNQVLGSASTPAGRCLAFPNILQHRVGQFRLTDPTRPGYRKILVFFLVDPSEKIVSTSDVPPQQPWSDSSTMTLEQANEYRDQLMQERKFFVDEHNEQLYEREFSLCEH